MKNLCVSFYWAVDLGVRDGGELSGLLGAVVALAAAVPSRLAVSYCAQLNLSPAFFFTCSALLFLLEYFSLRHNWAQDVRPVHCSLVEKLGFWNCWELGLVPHFYCSSSVFTTTVNNISTY
jgi:hypothetical protein